MNALAEMKVLEFGEGVAVPYSTKLLASHGAEVIKIEPPGRGDMSRSAGPFWQDRPDPERSGMFLHMNMGKLGITLSHDVPEGERLFLRLVEQTQLLITGYTTAQLAELGLDYQLLKQVNPSLVMLSLTAFGSTGPHADLKTYPLNRFHAGGEGFCLPGSTGYLQYPDRPPIKVGGWAGEIDTGYAAAMVALATWMWSRQSGRGQFIDMSQQEILLNRMRHELADINVGLIQHRRTRLHRIGGLFACKDGFVEIMPFEPHMWRGLVQAMADPEIADAERFRYEYMRDTVHDDLQRVARDRIRAWTEQHTRREIFDRCRAAGCAAGMVLNPKEVVEGQPLQDRGFFATVQYPFGALNHPGHAWQASLTPWRVQRAAPALGEHNATIYGERLALSLAEQQRLQGIGVI